MKARRILLYCALVLLVLGLVLFDRALNARSYVEEARLTLTNLEEKELDIFLQVNSLLCGLATLAFGGIGALMWDKRKGKSHGFLLPFAATCCGLSLYFGYLSYKYLMWMLEHHFFNLSSFFVSVPSVLQFCCFLISVVALADFIFVF
jgi:hypothetical protein